MGFQKTHGMAYSSEYKIWEHARYRCHNKNATKYSLWGGRGIEMDARWRHDFAAFYADMGPRPSRKHTLDRIDGNGPYSKENCRWATYTEQNNNKRTNRFLTHDGITLSMAQWAKRIGMNRDVLHNRIFKLGMSVERALTQPLRITKSTPNRSADSGLQ